MTSAKFEPPLIRLAAQNYTMTLPLLLMTNTRNYQRCREHRLVSSVDKYTANFFMVNFIDFDYVINPTIVHL